MQKHEGANRQLLSVGESLARFPSVVWSYADRGVFHCRSAARPRIRAIGCRSVSWSGYLSSRNVSPPTKWCVPKDEVRRLGAPPPALANPESLYSQPSHAKYCHGM